MRKAPCVLVGVLSFASTATLASVPDTEAVEFYNVTTGHFFITASATEAGLIDHGAAGSGWVRTGRAFQAWQSKSAAPADAQPVCRFYSSAANSHFYTASATECQALQALAAKELAATGTVRGWQFEGAAFQVQLPQSGQCPAGTLALSRVFNNGFATGEGSNHRFVDDATLRQLMVDRSWIDEGIAFCAPAKATGTEANLAATTTGFDTLAGTWDGSAQWKKEAASAETEMRAPLELVIAADGTVSGSGAGCAFSGKVEQGDGFRSLFTGTVSASGCTDAAFNGDYDRLLLERFADATMLARMKREASDAEVSISARLANAAAPTPAPTSGLAAVAGAWTGTVGWEAQATGQPESEANRTLSLTIGADGTVTGAGSGCAFSGTLSAQPDGEHFAGTVNATGCDVAAFNGALDIRVQRGDRGLAIEIGREAGGTEVRIEGTLQASGGTTPPAPPPQNPGAGTFTLVGDWSGAAGWFASERNASGAVVNVTAASETLHLTIAADGTTSGGGFGCTFAGKLTLTANAGGISGGTIAASGCTKDVFNGTYSAPHIGRDDGALEVELERAASSASGAVDVRIAGKLRKG